MRRALTVVVLIAAVSSCGGRSVDISSIPPIPSTTTAELVALLESSSTPTVVNVWASWCLPCRSEAPLLVAAAETHGSEVGFIGLNVRDDEDDARAFIAEYGLGADSGWTHLADGAGSVPVDLGGNRGVPLTFFVAAGGAITHIHRGVIDERTLALQIDELRRR